MKSKKFVNDIEISPFKIGVLVVCFALAILDMTFLYKIIHSLMKISENRLLSMVTAFIIATIANFTALMWGRTNGKNLARRAFNKDSLGSSIFWILIGLVYAGLRVANIVANASREDFNVIGEIAQTVILAISYIGTGITIENISRELFDANCVNCRNLKKRFNAMHTELSEDYAEIKKSVGVLEKYDINYKTLDVQRDKIERMIERHEKATLSTITGKTIQQNPSISPTEAQAVEDSVMERRHAKPQKG